MKKILSLIFALVLVFSCFAVAAFAEDKLLFGEDFTYVFEDTIGKETATISEDYQKLYVNGEPYSRVDASMLIIDYSITISGDYYTGDNVDFELSETQKQEIKEIYAERNTQHNVFYVDFTFKDGAVLSVTFLKDDSLDEYNKIVNGNLGEYIIDFVWPQGNTVKAQREDLFGEIVTKNDNQLARCDWFDVKMQSSDGSLEMYKGSLFIDDDDFYYLDYNENGLEETWVDTAYGDVPEFTLHKITDQELISTLKTAEQRYYDDDYGYLYDDSLTETVSAIFLILIFGVVPLVIFVIFLIKAIRGKGVYKKLYGAVAAFCIAELAIFTIITVIIASLVPASDSVIGGSDDKGYIAVGEEYVVMDTEYNEITDWDEI